MTHGEVLGRSLRELGFGQVYGVTVTRITRAGLEMAARPDLRLQFGDVLQVVGTEPSIQQVTAFVGNEIQELNHTWFIGVFMGLALGVFLGSLPIHIEAIPIPVKLGPAGKRSSLPSLSAALATSVLSFFTYPRMRTSLCVSLGFRCSWPVSGFRHGNGLWKC